MTHLRPLRTETKSPSSPPGGLLVAVLPVEYRTVTPRSATSSRMSFTTWNLLDLPLSEGFHGIMGYAVLDALGLKMGRVSGWVTDPYDKVRMIKLSVRDWFDVQEFLVPIGCITLIDDSRSQIHLRELTRRTLPKYCIEYKGELPEPQLLKSLIRYFPNPRPVVVERLERPDELAAPLPGGGRTGGQRVDGIQTWASAGTANEVYENSLASTATPRWRPLSSI